MRKTFPKDDVMLKLADSLAEQDRIVLVAYLCDFFDEAMGERARNNNGLSNEWLAKKALEIFETMSGVVLKVKQDMDATKRWKNNDFRTEQEMITNLRALHKK